MTTESVERPLDPFGWVGGVLDRKYRIDAIVGEGGFGVVYAGHHLAFDEPIAIKCLKLGVSLPAATRARFLDRFVDEGKLMYRLSQATPGIVRAIDVGAATSPNGSWTPYLILEWARGVTLEADLAARAARGLGGRSAREAVELLDPAARALDVAHELGVAHRDVKPGNLMLTDVRGQSTMKVLDFGVAKAMSNVAGGHVSSPKEGGSLHAFSPLYGAPEQFDMQFGVTGPWTDVFALGLVFAEVVTGKRALSGDNITQHYVETVDLARRPTPRALGVETSDEIERILQRALAVDPRNRYRRAGELWNDLVVASGATNVSMQMTLVAPAAAPQRPIRTESLETPLVAVAPRPSAPEPSNPAIGPVSRTVDVPLEVDRSESHRPPPSSHRSGPPTRRKRRVGYFASALIGVVLTIAGFVGGRIVWDATEVERAGEPKAPTSKGQPSTLPSDTSLASNASAVDAAPPLSTTIAAGPSTRPGASAATAVGAVALSSHKRVRDPHCPPTWCDQHGDMWCDYCPKNVPCPENTCRLPPPGGGDTGPAATTNPLASVSVAPPSLSPPRPRLPPLPTPSGS